MCGRDGPAPSRSQDYSGWSRVTDDRRRGASLISFPPEMTADGHVTVSRYSGMRSALAASASREHFALSFVALHHHRMNSPTPARSPIELCTVRKARCSVKFRDNEREKKAKCSDGSSLRNDVWALTNSFYNRTNRQKFLFSSHLIAYI